MVAGRVKNRTQSIKKNVANRAYVANRASEVSDKRKAVYRNKLGGRVHNIMSGRSTNTFLFRKKNF